MVIAVDWRVFTNAVVTFVLGTEVVVITIYGGIYASRRRDARVGRTQIVVVADDRILNTSSVGVAYVFRTLVFVVARCFGVSTTLFAVTVVVRTGIVVVTIFWLMMTPCQNVARIFRTRV